jgi:hypothetical protein
MTKPISWEKLAWMFNALAIIYYDEGLTELPLSDALPSVAIDADCDEWCRKLAADLRDPKDPPPHIRGWMFARAVCASSLAKILAEQKETSPGKLDSQLIEQFLIHEWHGKSRQLWPKLADYPRSASSWQPPDSRGSETRT